MMICENIETKPFEMKANRLTVRLSVPVCS